MTDLRVGFYGDDVTGSVDVLLQFARHGLAGRLFVGTPDTAALIAAAREYPVVGIAGIARSLPTAEIDAEVAPALAALHAVDPDVVQYKACSTVDSSPTVGSLGRVLEIGRTEFGDAPVPLLFAQPDFGRYTAFGHHFAAEGGTVFRLDRQPTMSTHPSTPMDDSDLARHIGRQTGEPIGALPFTAYASSGDVAAALRESADAGVVLDALDDSHLALVGAALRALTERHPLFAIGSGGLSRALALASGPTTATVPTDAAGEGPVLVVSGSRSLQTRRQVDAAARAGWLVRPLELDPAALAEVIDETTTALASGRSVALFSDETEVQGDALATIARAASRVVTAAVRAGATSRIIVCGGDTSGRLVRLVGVQSLSIAANPEGNVVLLAAHAEDPAWNGVELLLKGGQVGAEDLFVRLAAPVAR